MIKIKRITLSQTDVFDITVPDTRCFFANGILVHNCAEIALCNEDVITTPTQESGEIALCTLAAQNVGKLAKDFAEKDATLIERCADVLVRGLDALLDYQEYPHPAAKRHTMKYRPLGVGVIGYAHWLAKSNLQWGHDDTLAATEALFERISYNLIKASINLAKEQGAIPTETKYHRGIFPKDTTTVPAINLTMDWDSLRQDAIKYGIRNSTLMALMPSENSSILSNETNGIEPPKNLVTIKGSKEGNFPQVVPDFAKFNHVYETLWDVEPKDYLRTVSSMQKFVDQSISCNTSYNPAKYEITMSRLLGDLLFASKMGIKTLYYNQTNDQRGVDIADDGCSDGACKI